MFHTFGVLAFMGTLLSTAIVAATGYAARDVDKCAAMPTPILVGYVLLRGTATLCTKLGKVLDMALMVGLSKFAKARIPAPTPQYAPIPPVFSPRPTTATPAQATPAQATPAQATPAQATPAMPTVQATPLPPTLNNSVSTPDAAAANTDAYASTYAYTYTTAPEVAAEAVLPPPPSPVDSGASSPAPSEDVAVAAMLASVPRRRRAFPKGPASPEK
jgi:hypothetical protein